VEGILRILWTFKLNKSETSHDTDIDDAAIAIEELGHILRAGVRWKPAKIETSGHCGQ
jgi:hypothetical protein